MITGASSVPHTQNVLNCILFWEILKNVYVGAPFYIVTPSYENPRSIPALLA